MEFHFTNPHEAPVTEEASVFLEAHSWSEEQHNKLGGA
jgi:hypothetical protein